MRKGYVFSSNRTCHDLRILCLEIKTTIALVGVRVSQENTRTTSEIQFVFGIGPSPENNCNQKLVGDCRKGMFEKNISYGVE